MGSLSDIIAIPGRNVVINGNMAISQIRIPGGTTSISLVAAATTWTDTDMCGVRSHGMTTAVVNSSQQNDHPEFGGQGTCKSIAVTTAEVAIGAAEAAIVFTSIEGNLAQPLGGKNVVLSFSVKSPKAGIHCAAIDCSTIGQGSYVAEYTVNQINTWEKKVISIPAFRPASFTGGLAARICFPLAAGANFQNVPNVWSAGATQFYATANQQNLLDTIGNTFRVTDIQLEAGLVATPYEQLPWDQILQRCLRYYWNTFTYGTVPAQNNGYIAGPFGYQAILAGANRYRMPVVYPVEMRGIPVATYYNPFSLNNTWLNVSTLVDSGLPTLGSVSAKGVTLTNAQVAADAVGDTMNINAQFDARI